MDINLFKKPVNTAISLEDREQVSELMAQRLNAKFELNKASAVMISLKSKRGKAANRYFATANHHYTTALKTINTINQKLIATMQNAGYSATEIEYFVVGGSQKAA